MQKVINTYKNLGETPLECLERVRIEYGIASDVPMTYAGRLDPLAEGELIILVGDECRNKEKYLGFDKEYEVDVLFGISTDTHDVLGMIDGVKSGQIGEIDLNKYIRKFVQEYPRYSSRIIAMKEVPEEMPTKEVEIYSIEDLGKREMTGAEVLEQVKKNIALVKGDFRQKEIVGKWEEVISGELTMAKFSILKIRVKCSSGTYMRSLAKRMGEDEGVGAVAMGIRRVNVFM
jgi:tRNA pseudouridine55 synthase